MLKKRIISVKKTKKGNARALAYAEESPRRCPSWGPGVWQGEGVTGLGQDGHPPWPPHSSHQIPTHSALCCGLLRARTLRSTSPTVRISHRPRLPEASTLLESSLPEFTGLLALCPTPTGSGPSCPRLSTGVPLTLDPRLKGEAKQRISDKGQHGSY